MLAFTMQFSKHERTPTHTTTKPPQPPEKHSKDMMRHGGRTSPHAETPPTTQASEGRSHRKTTNAHGCPFPQDPTVCPAPHPAPEMDFLIPPKRRAVLTSGTNQKKPNSQCSTNEQTHPQDTR